MMPSSPIYIYIKKLTYVTMISNCIALQKKATWMAEIKKREYYQLYYYHSGIYNIIE